jgi:hypothetical protein
MKNLFNSDNHVGLLAAVNLGLAGALKWFTNIGEFFSALIPMSQIAVAIATVFYLAYRAKLANAEAEATKKTRKERKRK